MRFFIVFILTFLSQHFFSQGFRSKFTLPNSLSNTSKAVFETSPGNYFAAGVVVDSSNGHNYNRLVIMGLNQNGQLQWTKKYGNPNFEYLENSFISRSFYKEGNTFLHTCCVKDSSGKYFGVLIKFDNSGDTLWQKIYRDSIEDLIPQMCTASNDGGYLLTGFFQNWNDNSRKALLIKTDINGNELWRKEIGKNIPNVLDGKAILQDSVSKKIVIVGYQYIGNQTSWETYTNILILDSLGTKLGLYSLNKGLFYDLIQTKDKNFIAIGSRDIPNIPNFSENSLSYACKFNINTPNIPIWKVTDFGPAVYNNRFFCITERPNGNLMIGGIVDTSYISIGVNQYLARFTEIDPNGNIVWNKYYNYASSDSGFILLEVLDLSNTSDGGWVAALRCSQKNSTNPFLFIKYNSSGCDSTAAHCATVNLVGVKEANIDKSDLYIFPNPAQDQIQIQFSNTVIQQFNRLQIYNSIGQLVKNEVIEISSKNCIITTRDLPNGIYTLTFSDSNKGIRVKKLVIAR